MPDFHQAHPVNLVNADDGNISFVYALLGGKYDGKLVLVSSIAKGNYEETAIFLCGDAKGEEVDWNAIARVRLVDTEMALNTLGYTTSAPA
jgi:hypothetical protein